MIWATFIHAVKVVIAKIGGVSQNRNKQHSYYIIQYSIFEIKVDKAYWIRNTMRKDVYKT